MTKDLSFSINDRKENIRRISEVAKLFTDAGMIVITALSPPTKKTGSRLGSYSKKESSWKYIGAAPSERDVYC